MLGPAQRALETVEARQRDADWAAQHLAEEGGRPAGNDRDQGERTGEVGQEGRHPGQRPRPGRVLHDGGERPVEVEEEPGLRRLGCEGTQQVGEVCRGVARPGQRQEDATVVVVVDARSWPMTTTTSVPVTPLTGTAAVSGRTCDGFRPIAVAMAAACCWKPGA